MPKVSVLVPLYNTDENHLKEMIESVLNQTFSDFELLLLNDSPENESIRRIVKSYTDKRIVYSDNPKNLGISACRNKLIEMAKGEYLAIFDHDDVCMPKRLELQVAYMDQHPEVGVCGGMALEIPKNRIYKYPETNEKIKQALMGECSVLHPASMLRKTVLIENNIRYEAAYSPAEDYMLWIRLMAVTMFHNIQQPLIKYRKHENNTSHRQQEKQLDKGLLVQSIAYRDYPNLLPNNRKRFWIYLFDVVPILKVKRQGARTTYWLFGLLPLWACK